MAELHCVQVIGFLLFLADGDKVNINKLKQLNLCQVDAIFKVSQPYFRVIGSCSPFVVIIYCSIHSPKDLLAACVLKDGYYITTFYKRLLAY